MEFRSFVFLNDYVCNIFDGGGLFLFYSIFVFFVGGVRGGVNGVEFEGWVLSE